MVYNHTLAGYHGGAWNSEGKNKVLFLKKLIKIVDYIFSIVFGFFLAWLVWVIGFPAGRQ